MSTFSLNKSSGLPLKANENGDGTSTLSVSVSSFSAPQESDAFTVEYPNETTEIYQFRKGGISGTILQTVTLIYSNSSKSNLLSGIVS